MFFLLFIPFFLFANVTLSNDVKDIFDFSNKIIKVQKTNKLNFSDFNVKKCKEGINNKVIDKLALLKYEYYNNNSGLFLNTGGSINDKTGDDSLYAGFTWKLLKSGYRANKNQAQITYLQSKINQLNQQQLKKSFIYFNDYNFIIAFYNQKKIKLLNTYLQFLNLKYSIFKKRYFAHKISIDKLLLIKQKISNIKNLKNGYEIFNKKIICKNQISGNIGLFDLNYSLISKDLNQSYSKFRVKLNNKMIDAKYDKYQDWTLNLYASRELLHDQGDDFGFRLNIPLSDNKDEIKQLEKLNTVSNLKTNKIRLYLYLQKNYYVFKYKLSDVIKMKFKLAYVKAQLKRAKLRYQFQVGTDNLDRIISNIDSLFAIKLQLLDLKQQLLLKAYSLLYNLNLEFQNKYIKEVKVDTNLKLREGNRSLYVWANGFKKYDNNILIELFKLKHINTVFISVSKHEDFEKLNKFLKLAKENNIKVQFLIGNNSWIYPKNRKKIDEKLEFLKQYNNYNIHLDIEPQAMPDLKEDKQKYLGMYLDMLQYIHTKYPMYKLNIAIPTYYPPQIVIEMSKYVDKIYLMAYEFKNIAQLIRKVNKYSMLSSKLITVFNCKEFKNEYQLEMAIDQFIKQSGYKDIALHNLKEYIKVSQ